MTIKTKKGVSEVIATVFLILLTVAAVVALISFIKPFTEKNLGDSTECLPFINFYKFQEYFSNSSGNYIYNCYQSKPSSTLIGATVKTGTNLSTDDMEKLDGFVLLFSDDSESKSVNLTNGKVSSGGIGDIWRIGQPNSQLAINKPNEVITYVYNSSKSFSKLDVYPLLKNGRICEKTDSLKIKSCAGVSLT